MQFSEDDIRRLESLARLRLGDDERRRLVVDMASIVGHVDVLQSVNTDGVEPMVHAVPLALKLRVDEAKPVVGIVGLKGSVVDAQVRVRVPKIVE